MDDDHASLQSLGSFSSLPLSPTPSNHVVSSTAQESSSPAFTQQQTHYSQAQRHSHFPPQAFSRHFSFNQPEHPAVTGPTFSRFSSFHNPAPAGHGTFSRLSSFQDPKSRRALDRIVSMDRHHAPEVFSAGEDVWKGEFVTEKIADQNSGGTFAKSRTWQSMPTSLWSKILHLLWSGNRSSGAKKLIMLILLNFTYSTVELVVGLLQGRVGLVSDAFHLTFGCGLLSFSLIAMLYTKKPHDDTYTYGYERLEVLAALTNALFLLFLAFSLAVEALHAFVQDESEHKHYLIISAVTNLFVNLLGVWFFRSYARIRLAYWKAEDMNNHSIFLHVLADSIRSAGLILASWLLTVGVKNAETLCLGLVSIAVFLVVMPLFKAAAGVLLQMTPASMSTSILHKCLRQVKSLENVLESQGRFWEMVPGFVVGTLIIQVKAGTDEQKLLKHVHSVYNDIGIKDLTVQIDLEP